MPLSNVNSPFGFRLLRSGGKREVKRVRRAVAASRSAVLMVGDPYVVDTSGNAAKAGASDSVHGIVEGIELKAIVASPQGPVSQDYLPAADAGGIIGIEDPDALFVAQITTIASSDITKTVDVVGTTGDTTLRKSKEELDGATLGSGSQFKVMELLDSPADNAFGAYAKAVVRMLQTL